MAAAGGGDDPRRPPGPAHEYGPYKRLLLGIFEDMDNAEYKSFKHHLDCVVSSDNVSIPKYRIQRAKRQDMPDLILRYIQRREALEVVAGILRDLPNVQLLERIRQFTHPEPRSAGYIVMRVKHRAATREEYLMRCHQLAEQLEEWDPGLGNLILEEIRRQECVLVKYLLYIKELSLRPTDVLQMVSSEEHKEALRHLGVIYIMVEDATLFTGELHGDPRTWDPVEVTQWVARILLPRDPTATIPDLQMTGAEICTRPETWFIDKFPAGQGRVLYSDLQQRRDDTARQRRFGDRRTAEKRVVEGTRAAFLVMAYQICMMFYLLNKELGKAREVLDHLYHLVKVVKRRAVNKEKLDPSLFGEGTILMQHSIRNRTMLDSTQVSLVFGAQCIAVADETYNKAVTALCEAVEVIGAPLTIKINMAFWKKALLIGATAAVVGMTAGGAAAVAGASIGTSLVIGGVATWATITVLAKADNEGNVHLLTAYGVFVETEQRTVEFTSNYLKAVLLITKIIDRSNVTESELGDIIQSVEQESRESVIQTVEEELMGRLPIRFQRKIGDLQDIHRVGGFEYKATGWLHHDSVKDVNDSIIIADLQFNMRRLLRDVFILGVIGPEDKSKKALVKSVFPNAVHNLEQKSCDIVLYDGSVFPGQTLPVLLFPSGENDATKATLGLWTRSCSAFICVQDYTLGTPDLRELMAVAGLCVPVLLFINTKGRVRSQEEADRARERYIQYFQGLDLMRDLVQVVLVDASGTDKSPWITGGGFVKYWVHDALHHHQKHAYNIDKDFKDSLRL